MNEEISETGHSSQTLQTERSSEELNRRKDLWAEGNGNKQVTRGKKSGLVIAKLLSFRAWQGSVRQMT